MTIKDKKEVNNLTKDVVGKIDELCSSYRIKLAEIIEAEEEKVEKIEEHFNSSNRVDEILDCIDKLEDILAVFEEALDMMKGVEYV